MTQIVISRKNIVTPHRIERGQGLWPSMAIQEVQQYLPAAITDVTGRISSVSAPAKQGYCSHVLFLDSERGKFALKMAQPGYRGDELEAEFVALRMLEGKGLLIPQAFACTKDERGHYLLSSYCEGTPLGTLLTSVEDEELRLHMVGQMATVLAELHSISVEGAAWGECLESQLCFAREHLEYSNIDPEEFVGIDPHEVLRKLKDNPPSAGKVCLIHGDYRPKNMLWKENSISCVLDWAFCDMGDPYYDLAIIWYYLKTPQEKEHFMRCYGLERLDEERLGYFELLAKFVNV
ncbi:MAG: phosphotransferase [Peptococcaceae bacterium]|nr:phosphotransferase [Peptococcaceae bacterium]